MHNVIAVLGTFAFVFALGTTAVFVVNRFERRHQPESRAPDGGFRARRWRHRRREARMARRTVVDGSKDLSFARAVLKDTRLWAEGRAQVDPTHRSRMLP